MLQISIFSFSDHIETALTSNIYIYLYGHRKISLLLRIFGGNKQMAMPYIPSGLNRLDPMPNTSTKFELILRKISQNDITCNFSVCSFLLPTNKMKEFGRFICFLWFCRWFCLSTYHKKCKRPVQCDQIWQNFATLAKI